MDSPRWLDDEEQQAWRAFLSGGRLLMNRLDRELQVSAGMPVAYYEVLVTDIGLPDGSGYDLVREAKRKQPLITVALSGFGTDEDVRRSAEAGFDYHLTKPIDFPVLQSLLQKISVSLGAV